MTKLGGHFADGVNAPQCDLGCGSCGWCQLVAKGWTLDPEVEGVRGPSGAPATD